MVGAADEQKSGDAAERAGEEHRAHDNLLDVDAYVARGVFALADDGELIAVLAVFEIDVHENGKRRNDKYVEQVVLTTEARKPAVVAYAVDDSDVTRALGVRPLVAEVSDYLRCDVVHHQREERLVGVPLRLEERGDESPYRARNNARYNHNGEEKIGRELVAEEDHACRCCEAAHESLSLCADVPEFHLECGGDCERNAQEHCKILEQAPYTPRRADRAEDYRGIDLRGVLSGDDDGHDRADEQRKHDRADSDKPCRP